MFVYQEYEIKIIIMYIIILETIKDGDEMRGSFFRKRAEYSTRTDRQTDRQILTERKSIQTYLS